MRKEKKVLLYNVVSDMINRKELLCDFVVETSTDEGLEEAEEYWKVNNKSGRSLDRGKDRRVHSGSSSFGTRRC